MEFPGLLKYGVSTREDGSMGSFSSPATRTQDHESNRSHFFLDQDIALVQTVSASLNHGTHVTVVDGRHAGKFVPETDALVTKRPGLYLCVSVADCFPVFLFDPEHHVVGIAHAGWRGVVGGIVSRTVEAMCTIGATPASIQISIGPGLRECHLEIKSDVLKQFDKWSQHVSNDGGKFYVNLPTIIHAQLGACGVDASRINGQPRCTKCHPHQYFSYRGDGRPTPVQTMVAFIGMR